jgi:hypothetical protein
MNDRERRFNITGPCFPEDHYMVDIGPKLHAIAHDYIERGDYFTINRPRQYGKTTTLFLLGEVLAAEYLVIRLSFEGRDTYFESPGHFANSLRAELKEKLDRVKPALANIFDERAKETEDPLFYLRGKISALCTASDKPIVVMIDEVDKATNYQVFNAFLGLLRDLYISRGTEGVSTFQSVILAGVTDIKNLKRKIRPEEHSGINSPWNIAADFTVDMSFSVPEIAGMLREYESDHGTGMDIEAVAERIYFYTNGYPFLVSKLCKMIAEGSADWTARGVDEAVDSLVLTQNTLFDDMVKNVLNDEPFGQLIRGSLLEGEDLSYDPNNPLIGFGLMYGILRKEGEKARVSNIIFETVLYNLFTSLEETSRKRRINVPDQSLFVTGGKLDMDTVVSRFADFMKTEYRDRDSGFIETNARLLFLSYLKPIINGTGHYTVEPETRGNRRMDIRVMYGREEQIIELKIWRGEKYEQDGIARLAEYLDILGHSKGWLLSFCDLKNTPRTGGVYDVDGKTISETIVAFGDKA